MASVTYGSCALREALPVQTSNLTAHADQSQMQSSARAQTQESVPCCLCSIPMPLLAVFAHALKLVLAVPAGKDEEGISGRLGAAVW